MVKNATFISVWDGGFELLSSCKVNTETREVFNIEQFEDAVDDDGDELENLIREYIIVNGTEYCVESADSKTDKDYWYK